MSKKSDLADRLDMIEKETCSSCRIGIENLEKMSEQFNGVLESAANYYHGVCNYESDMMACNYEHSKYWSRYLKALKEIKMMIDQGKNIGDVKKHYFRDRC